MNIEEILKVYAESGQLRQLHSFLEKSNEASETEDLHLKGLTGSQDAFVAAAVFKSTDFNHLFVLSDKEEAAYFQNNLKNLLESKDV
ncbi:MAG TPA: hypothetical protein VG603_09095, partial [Chitinophagales bacterium]|nr:hypothetical protein [Chitinophagales bacterium]